MMGHISENRSLTVAALIGAAAPIGAATVRERLLMSLFLLACLPLPAQTPPFPQRVQFVIDAYAHPKTCLLYTSDAADE